MKKVIVTMSVVVGAVLFGAASLYSLMPKTVGTAVIAEKGEKGKVGGQAAILLPATLSTEQGRMLNMAYEIAKADGHKNPEIVQAVLLQETRAGGMDSYKVANPGKDAYFGLMQIKVAAARDVLDRWPALFTKYKFHTKTDDELKANLILNNKFNIEVGSKYLMILHKEYGFSGDRLMNAYNRGPGGVHQVGADFHYAQQAKAKLAVYKSK